MFNVCAALVGHFLADFVFQSRRMGKEKSVKFSVLLQHVAIQFVAMFVMLAPPFNPMGTVALFAAINAAIHGLIDWNIWRAYKWYATRKATNMFIKDAVKTGKTFTVKEANAQIAAYPYWEDHYFYLTIGFDQLLHALTIVILAHYILS